MSGLKQVRDRYSNDKSLALRSTEAQLKFIRENLKWLARADRKGVHQKFLEEIPDDVTLLADWQRSRIEKIYELVFKGYDMPAVNVHVDRKRKGLRFG